MTDYDKWDKIVASLSDDEDGGNVAPAGSVSRALPDPTKEQPVGVGAGLTDEGRVQSILRPGNARGNALSTNAAQPRVLPVSQYSWTDEGAAVAVRVPLAPLVGTGAPGGAAAAAVAQHVRAAFAPRSFELEVGHDGGVPYQLRISQLPGSLDPEACRHRVEGAGADAAVVLTLAKAPPAAPWAALGTAECAVKRPVVTVTEYRWSDEKQGVRIWVRVPGVHRLSPSAVRVRFRELSFDVSVSDLGGRDYQFAVTELPMEVVVSQCTWLVEEDAIKLYLRKWAKTGWHKLQLHR